MVILARGQQKRKDLLNPLRVSDCQSAITAIKTYGKDLRAISFDYDIGVRGNGGDVARFVQKMAKESYIGHNISFNIHSGNPPGVREMRSILEEVYTSWEFPSKWILEKSAKKMWENSEI